MTRVGLLKVLGIEHGSSGAAPWTPLNLANLVAWWDVSDLSTVFQDAAGTTPATANDNPIGLIMDKSGNGRHLSQASDNTKRPLLRTAANGINSLPVARGDGSNDIIHTATFTLSQPIHIVAVIRSAWVNGRNIFDGRANESINIAYTLASPRIYMRVPALGSDTLATGAAGILSAVLNGANSKVAVNGEAYDTDNTGVTSPNGFSVFNKAVETTPSATSFGEGVLTSAEMNADEYTALLQYYADKWGITLVP